MWFEKASACVWDMCVCVCGKKSHPYLFCQQTARTVKVDLTQRSAKAAAFPTAFWAWQPLQGEWGILWEWRRCCQISGQRPQSKFLRTTSWRSESDNRLTVPAEEISIKPQWDTEDLSGTHWSNYDERFKSQGTKYQHFAQKHSKIQNGKSIIICCWGTSLYLSSLHSVFPIHLLMFRSKHDE